MHSAADVLRQARSHARLTQRALARLASTTQSVVARIEAGTVSPRVDTLERLLTAAGLDLRLSAEPPNSSVELSVSSAIVGGDQSHMLSDVARILSLSPAARLRELANSAKFFATARRV
ncbi:MAG: helix-turn-helix transcriptional regulator [Gemmatimonas sp.]